MNAYKRSVYLFELKFEYLMIPTLKYSLHIVLLLIFYTAVQAQQIQWTVKAGETVKDALGDSVIYFYPQFAPGIAFYNDGKYSKASLNFNLLTGEMEFITSSHDTLAVANESTIRFIVIQNDTFYFDKFYVELLHSNKTVKLAKLDLLRLTDVAKEGAFGQMSSTSSINTITSLYGDNRSFYSSSQSYKLSEKSDLSLKKETIFFIADNSNHFIPATKRNIEKLSHKNQSALNTFIDQNKIAFNKEPDLIKLVDFIASE